MSREGVDADEAVLQQHWHGALALMQRVDHDEQLRLQAQRMQGSNCIAWLIMLLVLLICIGMYLFMKLFKKPTVS